jgi:hypothetical protein
MTKDEIIKKWIEEKKKWDKMCNEHAKYYTNDERLKAMSYSTIIALLLRDIKNMS